MKKVTIYTDGACSGNPGPGGWGAILSYGEARKEISGGEAMTTNNRMELTGAIKALSLLLAKGELQGAVVEGNGHERPVDVGQNLVLVVGPLGEAREELVHALVGGVVDVRAVLVNQDASLVHVVVGVARDVVATLEDANLEAAGLNEPAGAHRTGVSGTNDDGVIGVRSKTDGQTL